MTANELRQIFLDFFKEKGHAIIPSAPLVPQNDPTVLFTTAGMHPLVPYLLGQSHPMGKRLADAQKCIRTTDIDDVGDNRHLTFFEMLGNWSLGDYFKKEAIEWSWEFLTDKKYLGLDPKRLYVTVFMGDENSPIDQVAIEAWKEQFSKVGISAEVCDYNKPIAGNENLRIFPLPAKDNWWGPAGQTGPCGPCSEMFYDVRGTDNGPLQKIFDEEVSDFRIMEIWNDVFMEFNKTTEGKFEKLSQQNVDTGMGLERTVSVLNGKTDTFDNELFYPLFEKIEELSGKKYGESVETIKAMRIIADHLKAAAFIMAEYVAPLNIGQGYILRRLIRRAVRYGRQLGIADIFTFRVAQVVMEMYRDVYPELLKAKNFIEEQLVREEEKFAVTLEKGMKEFNKILQDKKTAGQNLIDGVNAFYLYSTFGFPIEMTDELAKEEGFEVDKKGYEEAVIKHADLSRMEAEMMFKGGLADHSEQVVKYHTATHMLQAALRQILGEHVFQRGSNITAERLRFDFSHPQKLTPDELKKVEDMVNQKIKENLPVFMEEMPLQKAKELGIIGVFEDKYGVLVKVYTIGGSDKIYSREICGGPHVERTGVLGHFKILKEEAVSAGVRRIKASLE